MANSMGGRLRQLGRKLGFIYQPGGEPLDGVRSRSRYDRGMHVSPRLEQDIDELRARIVELESRMKS